MVCRKVIMGFTCVCSQNRGSREHAGSRGEEVNPFVLICVQRTSSAHNSGQPHPSVGSASSEIRKRSEDRPLEAEFSARSDRSPPKRVLPTRHLRGPRRHRGTRPNVGSLAGEADSRQIPDDPKVALSPPKEFIESTAVPCGSRPFRPKGGHRRRQPHTGRRSKRPLSASDGGQQSARTPNPAQQRQSSPPRESPPPPSSRRSTAPST
jgi:hypothetical protein